MWNKRAGKQIYFRISEPQTTEPPDRLILGPQQLPSRKPGCASSKQAQAWTPLGQGPGLRAQRNTGFTSCAPAAAPCASSTHLGPPAPALPLMTAQLQWQRNPHPSSLPIGLSLVTPGDAVNTWILSCPRMRVAWELQSQLLHSLELTEQYQALIIYICPVLLEIYRFLQEVPESESEPRLTAPSLGSLPLCRSHG